MKFPCPHCGGLIDDLDAPREVGHDLPDNVDPGDGGNQRSEGGGTDRGDNRKIPRSKKRSGAGNCLNGRVIAIAVDLSSGKYEGPATIVNAERCAVKFPWQGNKNHTCWLATEEFKEFTKGLK